MYDRAEIRPATDRMWSATARRLRAAGIEAPANLTRGVAPWDIWRSPDLLLAQTCGLPYRARLHRAVALVATPDYGLPGCPPGHYRSVIVARAGEDPDRSRPGPRLAYNEGLSQSGWAAALDWAAARGIRFSALIETGGHATSVLAVAEGRADVAAIDAVTWRLMQGHDPAAAALREIDRTAPVPGLPLITAAARDPAPLAAALGATIEALTGRDRAALGIVGLARIPAAQYLALPIPPDPAAYAAKTGVFTG